METLVAAAMVTNLILILVLHIAALPFSTADSVQVHLILPIVIFYGWKWKRGPSRISLRKQTSWFLYFEFRQWGLTLICVWIAGWLRGLDTSLSRFEFFYTTKLHCLITLLKRRDRGGRWLRGLDTSLSRLHPYQSHICLLHVKFFCDRSNEK